MTVDLVIDLRADLSLRKELAGRGYAVITLSGSPATDLPELADRMGMLGRPLHVFRNHPFWKPLEADTARPLARSGGVGLNSLHIDCVNAEDPPDIVCLYCERDDPLGGGANIVAPVVGIEAMLSERARRLLERRQFRDGVVVDLDGVGGDANPFAVLDGHSRWTCRYTGRLLGGQLPAAEFRAIHELDQALWHRVQVVRLKPGQALVVHQRRMLHGRLPLGLGQEAIPHELRRRLVQAYWRTDD